MQITFRNGQVTEAVILARDGDNLRVAIDGADDAVCFSKINGTWVSDDCEPVRIEFAWERRAVEQPVREEDCICSHERAAQLIHLLYTDSSEDEQVSDVLLDGAKLLTATANH